VSGTNGINIAANGGNVTLRNLNLDGLVSNGLRGISITTANNVWIEDCAIFGFAQQAIADTRSTGGSLNVTNTVVRNNAGAGMGVAITGGTLKVLIDNLRSLNNAAGVSFGPNANVMIKNSDLSNNTTTGLDNGGASISADNNNISNNATGVNNAGSGTTRLSNNNIMFNTTGINNASGTVVTHGNNRNNTTTAGTITNAGANTSDLGQQ
jgi:hypothetical protein